MYLLKNYGKVNGIVYGGTSRKVKNYLQLGNKIFVIYNSKSQNKIGYFKTEILEAISPKYYNDKKRCFVFSQFVNYSILCSRTINRTKIFLR